MRIRLAMLTAVLLIAGIHLSQASLSVFGVPIFQGRTWAGVLTLALAAWYILAVLCREYRLNISIHISPRSQPNR